MPNLENRGLIGIKSAHTCFLQSYTNGELHADNPHRNQEETWFLWAVEPAQNIYALQNWRNGNFLSAQGNIAPGVGCAFANTPAITESEKWVFVKGAPYGVLNGIALRSVATGNYLGANAPGDDGECGGEVGCGRPDPPHGDGHWPGWWFPEAATQPSPGQDVWNTGGLQFLGVLVNIAPAVIPTLLAAL